MRTMIRALLFIAVLIGLIGAFAWATDAITMQGERTIYTVQCERGTWQADQCTGELVAAERYRFRALRTPGEVLFWVVGSTGPSGRFTQCVIKDGRNWACKANADSSRTITLEMSRGSPVNDATANTLPYHAVSKARWLLLKYGSHSGDSRSGS